jgi:predicted metalloprotease with PDZ domain
MPSRTVAASLFLALLLAVPARAQSPQATVALTVDASDAPRSLLHSHETISVSPGALTLLYPKWIPGEHGPTGPVTDVVGLKILAGGAPLPWRRDLEEMFAVHCDVPAGVSAVDVSFDYVLPPSAEGFSSGASSTPRLLVLSWNQVLMYPAGVRPDDITVTPSVVLPGDWDCATALTLADHAGATRRFEPVSLTMLVDSPLAAGQHLRRVDLSPPGGPKCTLDLVADSEAALGMTDAQAAAHRRLMAEAFALFGAHHFAHYDFLLTLSDGVAHFGLEHHQCSDDRIAERSLLDPDLFARAAGLLPHELVHSWNGKYRRPAGLATGDFSTPMHDDLLWVYEGLTEYLGNVLTARCGLRTPEQYRENLALVAAGLDVRPGRAWRSLQDTNDEASLLYESRGDWDALRRSTDFYDEGDLIWLEADVTIRELTRGVKSLDDFCKAFHGGASGAPALKPYTFDDVVATLDGIAPHDWRAFFTERLTSLAPHAPLGGIERAGWKLTYTDTPSATQAAYEASRKEIDLRFSLGLLVGEEDGELKDVIPGLPAAAAGLSPGMRLVAVDGRKYSKDVLLDALRLGAAPGNGLELLVQHGDFFETHLVDGHGGLRCPQLERDPSRPDLLTAIVSPTAVP